MRGLSELLQRLLNLGWIGWYAAWVKGEWISVVPISIDSSKELNTHGC